MGRVFISYSHEGDAHQQEVVALAQRLRKDGVDAWMDVFEVAPAEGWTRWMIRQMRDAEIVMCVCTKEYKRRFEGEVAPADGQGVNLEGFILGQLVAQSGMRQDRVVPVGFGEVHVPLILGGASRFLLWSEYPGLLQRLRGRPQVEPAPLPLIEAQSVGASFSPTDVRAVRRELWRWDVRGTGAAAALCALPLLTRSGLPGTRSLWSLYPIESPALVVAVSVLLAAVVSVAGGMPNPGRVVRWLQAHAWTVLVLSIVALIAIYLQVVVRFPVDGGSLGMVIGIGDRLPTCDCDGLSNVDCVIGQGISEAAVAACWGDDSVRRAYGLLLLGNVLVASAIGAVLPLRRVAR